MTLLQIPAEMRADVELWTLRPELTPAELDLLPLRWAMSRIDSFTPDEHKGWRILASAATGDLGEFPCATIASRLVMTLRFVLGERGAADYLAQWAAMQGTRGS
jgi:hypothetical protein